MKKEENMKMKRYRRLRARAKASRGFKASATIAANRVTRPYSVRKA